MNMQDKDIDELFRTRLDGMEVTPSDRVWKGIRVELDGVKPKRTLMPVLRIAAAITAISSVGLFFLLRVNAPNPNQVANNKHLKNQRVKLEVKDDQSVERVEDLVGPKQDEQQLEATTVETASVKTGDRPGKGTHLAMTTVKQHVIASSHKHNAVIKVKQQLAANPITERQQQPLETQTLAAVTTDDIKISQPVVPNESLTEVKPVIQAADNFKTTGKIAAVTLPSNKPEKAQVKKHGIRSLGDLINVVVAKVDKRPDKVIEFSNTDDDEATITGINLGFVKMKKEK